MKILKFWSYNLVNSANYEVLIIQFGEQCKLWSSYHTIWWAVQIMKCLSQFTSASCYFHSHYRNIFLSTLF